MNFGYDVELLNRLLTGWKMKYLRYSHFDINSRSTYNVYMDKTGKLWISTSPINLFRYEYHYE